MATMPAAPPSPPEDETYGWDHAHVPFALAVSFGAGLATAIGGALVFFPEFLEKVPQATILAISLALSAGVMLYVSFIEIFAKSYLEIASVDGISEAGASAITTVCFFSGMIFCALLELLVDYMSKKQGVKHEDICAAHAKVPASASEHAHANESTTSAEEPAKPSEVAVTVVGDAGGGGGGGTEEAPTAEGGKAEGELIGNPMHQAQLQRMGLMTAAAIAIHNFPEGLATFLATIQDTKLGASLGVAIAIHNIPEGLCVAMPIYYATGSKTKAFVWSLLSGVTEPIGGIIGFAALQPVFTDMVFGMIFSMVGGMMVFIVLHELLPAAHRYMNDPVKTTAWLILGMVIMATSLVLFVQ